MLFILRWDLRWEPIGQWPHKGDVRYYRNILNGLMLRDIIWYPYQWGPSLENME